ncbi:MULTISPECIES: hypothetical protein [unclassified Oceanobacter]|uniref:hypothetical protein n=1 Tax=unclassified Oceanobacter TaxID=2620260 RepID=UPI0027374927|nr:MULTISPECIES: hypothetical protein [unclassified Oceanobacter]MDP2610061.1 hypothetical protein [Oceanobacter sp. 1_MG-2023]MDP2613303.1 hypothetical protein [Oceanobacter sp. 2_MG-2023]
MSHNRNSDEALDKNLAVYSDAQRPCDKNGVPIYPLDVLKIYHFTGVNRKKRYIYKQVDREENGFLVINHLCDGSRSGFRVKMEGQKLQRYEVVQGYKGLPPGGHSFEDRERAE